MFGNENWIRIYGCLFAVLLNFAQYILYYILGGDNYYTQYMADKQFIVK